MPGFFDNTYHYDYSRVTYDNPYDKIKYQTIREADAVLEEKPPREPTRDEEVAY
jgi:hypothetical protein